MAQRFARCLEDVLKEIAGVLRIVLRNIRRALSHIAERKRAPDGSDRRNRPAALLALGCAPVPTAVAPTVREAEPGMHAG